MYLVTGGAGFIGSNILAALEERGYKDLVVCDRLRSNDKWLNLAKREIAEFVAPEALADFLNANSGRIKAILHMGAISTTTESDADKILDNNFRLSTAIWDHCAHYGTRLIYASSAATYGDGAHGFLDDASAEHLATLRPMNPYGWSKHIFDRRIARMIAEGRQTPPQWAGLKFFNVYGPNEYHKGGQQSVVAHIYPQAKAGQPARLFRSHHPDYQDGGQLRDFVWVGDVADVILWLLENPQVSGLYNLGTGQARSFRDLAQAVYRALNQEPQITFIDTPEAIRARYQYFTQADMGKLRQAGYDRPFTSLEDGVTQYVAGYLNQSDRYR